MRLSRGVAIGCITFVSIVCSNAMAQTIVTGEITGIVTDPSGAAVPGATAIITGEAYGDKREVSTDPAGQFRAPLLRPGQYSIRIQAAGFEQRSIPAEVHLGQVSSADVVLSVEQQASSVDVIEPIAPLMQNESATVASTLDSTQIGNLPAAGGDMVAYMYGLPGVTMSTAGGNGYFTAFGLPAISNLMTINGSDYLGTGASNLSLGSNEVQEAAIVTNGYAGQYGRQAGAQMNFVTRSGANAFHGNALWNWNGTQLNANDFFNNQQGVARPHAVSNQWGASLGGPIRKNKLFFFWDYEGIRYVLPSGMPVYIPTADFANAILNHLSASNPAAVPFYTKLFNVYGGASGAARALPVNQSDDPTQVSGGAGLGCGDLTGSLGQYGITVPCSRKFQSSVNSLNTEWLSNERIDYNVTDRDHVYFRAGTDRGLQATGTDAINPAFNANSSQPGWSAQLGYTRIVSGRAVNELLLSGSWLSLLFGPPNLGAALEVFPTTMMFTNGLFTQLGGGANPSGQGLNLFPQGRKVLQWQIIDDYAYTRSGHQLRAGVNFRRSDLSDYTFGVGTSGLMTVTSMTDFYNGLLANGSTYTQSFPRIGSEPIGLYSLGVYGQDQWQVRRNLSLTLAVRIESAGNPSCARDCFARPLTAFEEIAHDASIPYNTVIATGQHNAFRNLDGLVLQPRAGFAYSARPKLVIRGGIGLFADQFDMSLYTKYLTNPPNVASFTTASGVIAPGVANSAFAAVAGANAAFQQGFAGGATLAQMQASVPGFPLPNVSTLADSLTLPRYLEWNFELQQEIAKDLLISANYVGNHGWNEFNLNPWLNAYSKQGFGGLPTAAADTRFGQIVQMSSPGYSNYNGLTTSLKWRKRSFTGQIGYSLGHALDTCSNNCTSKFNLHTAQSLRLQASPYGLMYGNADYDVRHSLAANYVWTVPAHFRNVLLKAAFGAWTIGGTVIAHTGYPYSVVNSSLRGSYVKNGSGITTLSMLGWWTGSTKNPCAGPDAACLARTQFLSTAQQTAFGNLERNSFRGPRYVNTDLALNKNVTATERFRVTVGAALFNALNHPNFDLPVNNLALGNFGQITSTVSPASSAYGAFQGAAVSGRVIVTSLRFQF